MQASSARRERLVSLPSLALLAGLFAVAFFVLKPNTDVSGTSGNDAANADQLQLAYLKAQNHADKSSDTDVLDVVEALMNGGRIEQAKKLLIDYPELEVSEILRFEIDLVLAATQSPVSLYSVLNILVKTPRLHKEPLLERAVSLSLAIEQPQTSNTLFRMWAESIRENDSDSTAISETSNARIVTVYEQCGNHMAAVMETELAISCFNEALNSLPESISRIDLQISLLPLLDEGSRDQKKLLQQLMQDKISDTGQLARLAPIMLALQRPDLAYRLYARLALHDPDSSKSWLAEAVRWAVAAGKPAEAAVFLESFAAQTDPVHRQTLYDQIEQLLVQAGQSRKAYALITKRIRQQPNDVVLLERGIVLARQLNESQTALNWNTQLLSLQPSNQSALERQADLALATGDLPKALEWSETRVAANKNDPLARHQLAQVSEWNAKPHQALAQWLWKTKQGHSSNESERRIALREVVRLAQLTLQPDIAAQALRELTLLEFPSNQDVVQLVNLYELDGNPAVASTALHDIMVLHGESAFVLRTLADHEYHHKEYEASLEAWNKYASNYGQSTEATLAQMELLWRMDKKDQAMQVVTYLKGRSLASQASDYQLRVMAEISWRYRLDWLTLLVQPNLAALEVEDERTLHGQRSLSVLQNAGKNEEAMNESIKLWNTTGHTSFALLAMQLAVKIEDKPVIARFSPEKDNTSNLQLSPAYWAQIAATRLRNGDTSGASQAYQRALKLDESHIESVASLIWLAIGEQDTALLQSSLFTYKALAKRTPELWQAMAIGYLQLGAASTSLAWFDRMLDQIETDYSMLLSYADALEYAGRAADAHKVRQYTLQKLRPILIDGSYEQKDLLLRQYASLSTRYASVGSNTTLVNYLLIGNNPQAVNVSKNTNDQSNQTDLWREDIAISWLMSTQQFDHARVVMADIHAKRLNAPVWQRMALALKDKDQAELESILQAQGPLSIGNHILALRQLGNDKQAYALAQQTLQPDSRLSRIGIMDRRVAQQQYASLRQSRPSYITGVVQGRSVDGLNSTDTGVNIRHSFANSNLGLSIDARQRQLSSERYRLNGLEEQTDLSMSLFFGNSTGYGKITAGVNSADAGERSYGSGRYAIRARNGRSELSTEIAYNEPANYSSELSIAGAQNRATLGLDSDFGKREFVRLRANVTEINTRLEQNKVARGLGGSIEVGMRSSFGSNNWTTSMMASQVEHDREAQLPAELRLTPRSHVNSVLVKEVQNLSIGASLSRGGINADFPLVSAPRYYVNTRLGHNWPEKVVGFQIDAGAGIRILGGDELSFSVSHDSQPIARQSDDATSLGVQYRYHFQ